MGDDLPDFELGINVLKQALASLTAVVTATALDIRALDSTDKGHIGLPYDMTSLTKNATNVTDSSTKTLSIDKADWGTNKAWITYGLIVRLNDNDADFNVNKGDHFKLYLYNTPLEYAFRKQFPAEKFRPVFETPDYDLYVTIFIPNGFYSTSSQVCYCKLFNYTGVELDNYYAYWLGLAIDE